MRRTPPRPFMAWAALLPRLRMTCSISVGLASTTRSLLARASSTRDRGRDAGAQERNDLGDEGAEIDGLAMRGGAPAEGEDAGDEVRGAAAGLADLGEIFG